MSEVFVFLFTLLGVSACAWLGYWLGFRRVVAFATRYGVAWALGVSVCYLGLSESWFQPFGLITPVILGTGAGVATWVGSTLLLKKTVSRGRGRSFSPLNRLSGSWLGAVGGLFLMATLWLFLCLADGLTATNTQEAPTGLNAEAGKKWMRSILRTTNRGLVRHLPIVGPLADEVEAVTVILNSDARIQRRLARQRNLDQLVDVPSFRAIVEDGRVLEEIDAVAAGDLTRLYSLQKNPLVIAFFEEEKVQAIVSGLRPSTLARQLEEMESAEANAEARRLPGEK